MASVTLTELWLHNINDYSIFRRFGFSQVSNSEESDSRNLKMANGRFVSVRTPGIRKTWDIGLRLADRADAEWIRARVGETFLVRTAHGEKFFATLDNVSGSEELLRGDAHLTKVGNVSFQMSEVSLTEEV